MDEDTQRKIRDLEDRLAKLEERRVGQSMVLPQAIKQRHLEDTGWTPVTLLNSWVNYDTTFGDAETRYVRKIGGTVYFRGLIKSGTTTAYTPLFTLPVGLRPSVNLIFICACSTSEHYELRVGANGVVKIGDIAPTATWVSISGVSFIAEN